MEDGLKYFNRENYRRALEIFLDELEKSTRSEDVAYNANLAGLCLYFLHYPRESLKYFQMALDNTQGDDNARVQENMDEVRRFIERVEKDIEEIKSRIEIEDDKRNMGILLSNLGLLQYFLGMREDAESSFSEAEKIFRDMKDQIALGALYTNFAMLYDDMRKLDYLYKALSIFEDQGHIRGQVDTLHSLALYYLEDDYEDEAMFFLKKELELIEKIDDREMKRRLYELMAEVEMDKGNVEEAMRYTEKASGL